MQIPGFKKAVDSLSDSSSSLKPLPALAPVAVSLSRQLIYCYQIAYLLLAMCLLLVVSPWLIVDPAWVIFLAVTWLVLWVGYLHQKINLFVGTLWFEQRHWSLQQDGTQGRKIIKKYQLAGEVLCWPLLIILPLQEVDNKKRKYLLIANDALSPADRARLRTWLRVCLKPKV